MKSSFKSSLKTRNWVTICILAVSIVGFVSSLRSRAMAPAYSITDLGTLGGSPHQSHGYGINNCGTTVGDSVSSGGIAHPFYKKGATMTDLGGLGGDGAAYSVNSSGYTVGYSNSLTQRAFLWHDDNSNGISDPGEFHDFLPADTGGVAYAINDNNRVVGVMDAVSGQNLSDTPFTWDAINGVQSLPTPPAGTSPSRALGINNAGTIAGWLGISATATTHAFILKNSTYTDLGTLNNSDNSLNSFAWGISEDEHVVGYSQSSSNNANHPFVWSQASGMIDLGTLSGTNAFAYDINASGFVVGTSQVTGGGTHAFVWHDDNGNGGNDPGEMKDLNSQISDAAWTTLVEARSINDGGQIVGWGTMSNGETHAFLLTPAGFTPPPCPGATPTPTPTPTPTYSVSGQVKDGANAPVSGVLITFDMSFQGTPSTATTLTDANGNYSSGDLGCKNNVTVTPSKGGLSFTPLASAFTSSGCLTGTATANFTASPSTAAPTSLISVQGTGPYGGTATLSAILFSNDMPVSGKTISFTLNSTAVCGGSTGVTCPVTNGSGIATLSGVSLTGISAGSYPNAVGASFAGDSSFGSSSQTGLLSVTPFLLLENGANNAAAVDSVTFVRGPFRVTDDFNFSGDHITRIIIFTSPLPNPEPTLKVFASGHELQVESFGTLTGVPGLNVSYIIVKLDPILTGSGPINYDLSVSFRGVTSNTGTLTIIP